MSENPGQLSKQKAEAIMDLVNFMIAAFDHGFVDTPNLNLAQLHRIAQNHCEDMYGIKTPHILEAWGEEVAKDCGFGATLTLRRG